MKLFLIGVTVGIIVMMLALPFIVSYLKDKTPVKQQTDDEVLKIDDDGHLIFTPDILAEMIREDVTKQYIRQIWMNVAVALIPLMLTFTATAYCIITEYNNDINRQVSEHNLQTQERICQLEKQIAILGQKLECTAEQNSD